MSCLGPELTAILDAAVSRIVPTDENGPGAREIGVVDYIAGALEGEYADAVSLYRAGLAGIETSARSTHGKGFSTLTPAEQDAVLTAVERGERGEPAPDPSPSGFFELLLQHVREGMFGDPAYGGNRAGLGWQLLGYPGPRPEWSAVEQRIAVER